MGRSFRLCQISVLMWPRHGTSTCRTGIFPLTSAARVTYSAGLEDGQAVTLGPVLPRPNALGLYLLPHRFTP